MEEIRRFMRYTLPGLSTVFVLITSLYITNQQFVEALFSNFRSNGSSDVVGLAIAGFLASGALGFLLANIYFLIYWSKLAQEYLTIDHREVLKNRSKKIEIFKLEKKQEKEMLPEELDKREAWRLIFLL